MKATSAHAIRLALLCSREVQQAVNPGDLAKIRARNVNRSKSNYCASHDFCNAADLIGKAFEKLAGRPLNVGEGKEVELCDVAWKLAKHFGFFAQGIAAAYDLDLRTGLRNVHTLCGGAPLTGIYYGVRGSELVKRRSADESWSAVDMAYRAAKLINENDNTVDLSEACRDADRRFDTSLEAKWRSAVEAQRSNRWDKLSTRK